MASRTAPFAGFEWAIAWRYLRASRKEGGVSVMSIISLVGVALAVFALIATMAVRSGFRTQFVDTIIGANAHVTVFAPRYQTEDGMIVDGMDNYDELTDRAKTAVGVTRAAPVVKGQVMATSNNYSTGAIVFGERYDDLLTMPMFQNDEAHYGDLSRFDEGVSIGLGVANRLGLGIGDYITLIAPGLVQSPFGSQPRIVDYEVVHVFPAGRDDIDSTRIYMPFAEAQSYFNKEGLADEIEILVDEPEEVETYLPGIQSALGGEYFTQTWRQAIGSFLQTLKSEDSVMFILMSILVLVATLNIVSGLIMLVKNKGRDIGILRTIGLTEGSVLRVFFICGASIGVVGTLIGVILGSLFVIYIDPIFEAVNMLLGGGAWNPAKYQIYRLPAELTPGIVLRACALSLGLSFIITIFPARRAARMNPVEALRYE
jgi:lipoprotein-releasing system permease protein